MTEPPAVPAIPCRTCGRRLPPGGSARNRFFPFCSERCRNLDMGDWLDERYRVAGEAPAVPEPEEAE